MIQDLTKKILGDSQLAEMKTVPPLKDRISKLESNNAILIKAVDKTKLLESDISALDIPVDIIKIK